jgi:hypothetical protein
MDCIGRLKNICAGIDGFPRSRSGGTNSSGVMWSFDNIKIMWLVAILCSMMIASACSREKSSSVPGDSLKSTQQSSGKFTVRLLPEAPTVTTDLQVVHAVGGNVGYRWARNGRIIEEETAPLLSRKWFSRGDTISVTVIADGQEAAASIMINNSPPVVTSVMLSPEQLRRGVDITALPQAVDADGDNVRFSYKWRINGNDVPEDRPMLNGNQFKRGDRISLTVTPYDSSGPGEVFNSKEIIIPNAAPSFVTTPPKDFSGDTYFYQAMAEDPDGDPITYSLVSPPAGMTIDSNTGMIQWKIGGDQAGNHTIEIVAQDPEGAKMSQKYTLAITIPER